MFRGQVYDLMPESNALPKFEKLKPVGVICSHTLNVPTRVYLEGIPGVTTRTEWFAIDYEADFWIDAPGAYMFTLASDDGSKLYIDGRTIIDNDGHHATVELGGRAKLETGEHHMRVSYFQGPREYVALVLKVAPPHGTFEVFDLRTYRSRAAPKPDSTVAASVAEEARPILRRAAMAHDPLSARAFEAPALAALAASPRLHDFEFRARVFRFIRGEMTQCALAVEVPVAQLTSVAINPERARLHLVMLAVVKDHDGKVIQKWSEDFPVELTNERLMALKNGTLRWRRNIALTPGEYTIETVAVDREANRASVTEGRIDAHVAAGVTMSDPVLAQRIEAVTGTADPDDPLEAQGKRVVTDLGGASSTPSIYFVVYSNPRAKEKARVTFELSLDGKVAGRQTSELPDPDAEGAIPITIAAPANPGKNRLRITVQQGPETAERVLEYSIAVR